MLNKMYISIKYYTLSIDVVVRGHLAFVLSIVPREPASNRTQYATRRDAGSLGSDRSDRFYKLRSASCQSAISMKDLQLVISRDLFRCFM